MRPSNLHNFFSLQALAARLSAVMSHAEQWEAQLRAQHDAELRHVRDVAEERERQRKGEDVR